MPIESGGARPLAGSVDVEPLADQACGPGAILDGLEPTQDHSAYGWRIERASMYTASAYGRFGIRRRGRCSLRSDAGTALYRYFSDQELISDFGESHMANGTTPTPSPIDNDRSAALLLVQVLGALVTLGAVSVTKQFLAISDDAHAAMLATMIALLIVTAVLGCLNCGARHALCMIPRGICRELRKAGRQVRAAFRHQAAAELSAAQKSSWQCITCPTLIRWFAMLDILAIFILLYFTNGIRGSIYGPLMYTVIAVAIALRDDRNWVVVYAIVATLLVAVTYFIHNSAEFLQTGELWGFVLFTTMLGLSIALPVYTYHSTYDVCFLDPNKCGLDPEECKKANLTCGGRQVS